MPLIKIRGICDRAGARTQDPLLKREMLYQLSYQVLKKCCGERRIRTFEACAADLQSALVGHLSISPKFNKKSTKSKFLVTGLGLEPRTLSLKGRCSTN